MQAFEIDERRDDFNEYSSLKSLKISTVTYHQRMNHPVGDKAICQAPSRVRSNRPPPASISRCPVEPPSEVLHSHPTPMHNLPPPSAWKPFIPFSHNRKSRSPEASPDSQTTLCIPFADPISQPSLYSETLWSSWSVINKSPYIFKLYAEWLLPFPASTVSGSFWGHGFCCRCRWWWLFSFLQPSYCVLARRFSVCSSLLFSPLPLPKATQLSFSCQTMSPMAPP